MIARTLAVGLLEALFPPPCAACGEVGREPFCRLCAEALLPAEPVQIEGAQAAWAMWAYGGPAARAVRNLKYDGQWALGRALGLAMVPGLSQLPAADVIVPVPLSPPALVKRGYNQARELARGLPVPVRPRALERVPGPSQVGLSRQARLTNLSRSLRAGPESVAGLRVILVDDVITTGATAQAAIEVLSAAGAKSVCVLAATHTCSPAGT